MRQGAQGWCTGMTLRDGMGREVGEGFRMGNTCTPMADSCQCMAKTTATPWTLAYQAPPSMEFSRQEYWTGLPFTYLGNLPDPGIEPRSSALQADALPSEPLGKPVK